MFTTEPGVLKFACERVLIILALEPVCGLYEIPAGFLRGVGYSALPAAAAIIGTCVFRIIWIYTIVQCHHTQPVMFLFFPVSWGLPYFLCGWRCGVNAGDGGRNKYWIRLYKIAVMIAAEGCFMEDDMIQ